MYDEQPRRRAQDAAKQAYRKPRLRIHGTVQRLTEAKAGRSSDGGGKPRTRARGRRL
jgi:hypothetical protein